MFPSICLAMLLTSWPVDARAGENKLTQLDLKPGATGTSFEWADAEDTLRGSVAPLPARLDAPVTLTVTVQPKEGQPYDGPVILSLRPLENMGAAQTVTASRQPGEKLWKATFTPTVAVDHRLEISWRTTHHKVVTGVLQVQPGGLPPWVAWSVSGTVLAAALGYGLWILFRKDKESPPS